MGDRQEIQNDEDEDGEQRKPLRCGEGSPEQSIEIPAKELQ